MSIGSTVKQYPTGIDTFATWQDDIDNILAVIVNDVQDQVIAIETELGTDPAGSLTDLKTRLAVSINDDGTLKSSNQWTLNVNDIYNNNAGNVGIGTSTPQAKLHVIGDIVGKNDDTSNLGSAARRWAAIYMASTIDYAGDLNFDSSGTKVTFKTDGNVGIGSTQPAYTLDVGGDSRVIASTGAEGYTELQRWCLVSPQHDNYYLSLKQNVAVGNVKWQIDHRDDGVDYLANLVFNKGTIGIGTTNPQASLHVIGDIVGKNDDTSNLGSVARRWANIYMASTIDYASDLNFDSSGTNVTFKTDGKVGIGTDSPDAVIEATGVGTDIGKFRRIATGTGASCRLELGVDTTYYKSAIGHVRTGTGDNGLGKLYFAVDSVGDAADVDLIIDAKMVIDANDNVGIGVTNPLQDICTPAGDFTGGNGLHVKSDISSNNQAYIILEGDSTGALGHRAATLVFADNAGATDEKMMHFSFTSVTEPELEIATINDSAGARNGLLQLKCDSQIWNFVNCDLVTLGNVGIGTTLSDKLSVEGQISLTQGGDRKFKVDTTGQIYSDAGTTITQPADFAEWNKVKGNLKDYEVGTIVQQSDEDLIVKLANDQAERIYGVVTNRATFLGSLTGVEKEQIKELTDEQIEKEFNAKKIAMIGHIKVKIKGLIFKGQSLTLSEVLGVARGATTFEEKTLAFAIAREAYDSEDVGLIEIRLL